VSGERAMTRRGLLRMFAPPPPPAPEAAPPPPAFSLDAFYAGRESAGSVAVDRIPTFAITAREVIPTSSVGTPAERDARSGVAQGAPLAALPPGMVPELRPHACIASSSFCSVCVERCPAPGALVMEPRGPRVVEEACTGCGKCIQLCPAPVNGFSIVPRRAAKEVAHGVRDRA
jgi:ferredoxin